MSIITHQSYLRPLEAWIPFAKQWLYQLPNDPECICFGTGNHGHWSLQASNTAFGAFSILASDPDTDCLRTGMSRDELGHTAHSMLRFALRSHHVGPGSSTDGDSWGHSWISALCQERFFHAVEAIDERLTDADRGDFRNMLISEADWLLKEYPVVAGLTKNNKPESNAWNGALLYRAATLFPDTPHAADYREKGTRFLVNAISIPTDETLEKVYSGRPVSEWFEGANFFDSYSCNHHGYMNVGYMIITLSNLAMPHFFFRNLGIEAPPELYHHVEELWKLVKTCTFPDGRLMRIGGDSRVRYCYCQDYAIPVWLMMRDQFGDADCEVFESEWLKQLQIEQDDNPDGSFMGKRLATMADVSPLYFTRLEGDKAVTLSMGAYWRRRFEEFADKPVVESNPVPLSQWSDEYHGASLVRGTRRTASWIWRSAELPQGLCLVPEDSSMAEWKTNLAGRVRGMGMSQSNTVVRHDEMSIPGGFGTCGQVKIRSGYHFAEGAFDEDIAIQDLAFAALPDDATVVGFQRARSINRVFLHEAKGLMLQIPNEVHCGFKRQYQTADGVSTLIGRDGRAQNIACADGWVSIENRLGVVAINGGELCVNHPEKPGIPVRSPAWENHAHNVGGMLYVDEVCIGCRTGTFSCNAGETLYDVAFAMRTKADAEETAALAKSCQHIDSGNCDLRAALVPGADGATYLVAANFGEQDAKLSFNGKAYGIAAGTTIVEQA